MSTQQDLWDYASAVFSLPPLRMEAVSIMLGTANIDAISANASDEITNAVERINDIEKAVDKLSKKGVTSHLQVEEVRTQGACSRLVQQNMSNLIELLRRLRSETTDEKFVLPQFRGVKHFEIGDEVMIHVGAAMNKNKLVGYDWVSAKMLCPGWDWVMHCHSNVPWTDGGSNGGHYFRTTDQNSLFKRSDFYGLRNMLEQRSDESFTNLLPAELAKQICEGTVEPLTDEELATRQASYIKRAKKVVYFYPTHVPLIAERYGIAA